MLFSFLLIHLHRNAASHSISLCSCMAIFAYQIIFDSEANALSIASRTDCSTAVQSVAIPRLCFFAILLHGCP
ncbi:unnamed protein product, partial [Vitis vinifera]|uniref:Secreted protein n=1 Tax=Vitis vinifera TaxID=29760 RepID=D7U9I6_VITVI